MDQLDKDITMEQIFFLQSWNELQWAHYSLFPGDRFYATYGNSKIEVDKVPKPLAIWKVTVTDLTINKPVVIATTTGFDDEHSAARELFNLVNEYTSEQTCERLIESVSKLVLKNQIESQTGILIIL